MNFRSRTLLCARLPPHPGEGKTAQRSGWGSLGSADGLRVSTPGGRKSPGRVQNLHFPTLPGVARLSLPRRGRDGFNTCAHGARTGRSSCAHAAHMVRRPCAHGAVMARVRRANARLPRTEGAVRRANTANTVKYGGKYGQASVTAPSRQRRAPHRGPRHRSALTGRRACPQASRAG